MTTDIHTKIREEVERRLAIARAAAEGGAEWRLTSGAFVADFHLQLYSVNPDGQTITSHGYTRNLSRERADHISLHDPADAIRRYTHALKILERHSPDADGDCSSCAAWGEDEDPDGQRYRYPAATSSPCFDVLDLAESLGIDTGGQP